MSGRQARLQTAKGARRSDTQPKPPAMVELGRYDFRFTVRRGRGGVNLADISLDDLGTEATWQRSGSKMTGTLSFNEPIDRVIPGLVVKGDVVRTEVLRGGAWLKVWEMTVGTPTFAIREGTRSLTLSTRLEPATRSRRGWRFRKDRLHPRGWKADKITAHAAARFEVPVGRLAKGQHWIERLVDKSASVVEIATEAYRQERLWTGRRFDISVARGILEVVELRRPAYMLALGNTIIDALLKEGLPEAFASAVIVESTVKAKGSTKRRKIKVRVINKARIKRFGYVVKTVHKSGLKSEAEARRYGTSWLARHGKPVSTLSVTVPGLPWVDRGDALSVSLPEAGYPAGLLVFVRAAVHRLTYASYEMDLDLGVKDPWDEDERAARERRNKAAAARKAKRKGATAAAAPKPKKAARRS